MAFANFMRRHSLIRIILPLLNVSEAEAVLPLIKDNSERFIVVFKNNNDIQLSEYILAIGVKLIKQEALGIYNAINLAIGHLDDNDFYIVMGSDDIVSIPAVKKCEDMDLDHYCVYNAEVKIADTVVRRKRSYLLHAHKALVSEHAVGSLLSKKIHNKYGLYSENNIIASDAKFLMRLKCNNVNFIDLGLYFGSYGGNGISTNRYFKGQMELISSIFAVHAWYISSIMISFVFIRIIKNAIFR